MSRPVPSQDQSEQLQKEPQPACMQAYSLGVVTHVLRAVKCFEGQAIQEVPWVQQPCHWPYLPTSVLPAGDVSVVRLM